MTNVEIEKIKSDYRNGLKYKDIQEKYNITKNQLIYLIQKNKWKRSNNRSKALKKNQNEKGNKGGKGAEKGNKNAVTTGEYENIFSSVLSENEKNIFETYSIKNKKDVLLEELKILTIREIRMLDRIKKLQDKNSDMYIDAISKTNESNAITTTTHAESVTNAIQKIEEALTRVQESKRRCIESLNKIGIDAEKLEIEKKKLEIEKKRLEIELQNVADEEIEDTSETDADIYGN